jgi:hypothetical protein
MTEQVTVPTQQALRQADAETARDAGSLCALLEQELDIWEKPESGWRVYTRGETPAHDNPLLVSMPTRYHARIYVMAWHEARPGRECWYIQPERNRN